MAGDVTTPSKLWSFDRKTETDNVDRYVRPEAVRATCYAVVDAVLAIRGSNTVAPEHVAAFVAAAEASHQYAFVLGGKRLVQCSHFSPLAVEALRGLSAHRRWGPRFNVMCVLGYGPPDALALELLHRGLADKSARVACRAADACDELREVPGVVQLLDERLAAEKRPEVIESLRFNTGLARAPEVREGRYLVREYHGIRYLRDAPRGRAEHM